MGGRCGPRSRRRPSPPSARTRRTPSSPASSSSLADLHEWLAVLYGGRRRGRPAPGAGAAGRAGRRGRAPAPSSGASTGAARSTPAGSSAPACRATSATSTGSAAPSPSCPGKLDYLAELGTTYLHLMPLLQPRPGENDGGYAVAGLPRGRPAAGHDGRPRGRRPRAARPRDEPLHRPRASTTPPASTPGRRAGWPATRPTRASTPRSPTGRCPTPTTRPSRRSSPTGRRARSPGCRRPAAAPAAGCGRRSGPTSGTSTTRTPRSRWRCSARSPGWPTAASTSSAWTPSRSCGSAWAPPARTSRRGTRCSSCCTRSPGWPRRASSSRPRRSCRPRTWCPTSAATSGTARSASWRTTTSSW